MPITYTVVVWDCVPHDPALPHLHMEQCRTRILADGPMTKKAAFSLAKAHRAEIYRGKEVGLLIYQPPPAS